RVLAQELERAVDDGDLTAGEAEAAGEGILRGNALKLYGLPG
ncbi:MAG: amidohydrolase, partial [Chloroflexi bacterium]|nr:amidohydrolase [Chloroflexota bacterium]